MSECVNCTIDNHIAIVVINRPKALNALNEAVLTALYNKMEELDQNKAVKVVIITGSGEKAFVAGADIAAMQKMSGEEAQRFSRLGQKTMDKIANMRPFVIASINGYALGGGCELAMACDMRIASDRAKLGIPEVTLGVFPGFGGTQRLPRLVGLGIAKELLATGRQVSANEAEKIGLVNKVVAPTELVSCCLELAEQIAENSTSAISYGKQAMTMGTETDLAHALEMEASLFGMVFTTADQKEGMDAFLSKRKPVFQ